MMRHSSLCRYAPKIIAMKQIIDASDDKISERLETNTNYLLLSD